MSVSPDVCVMCLFVCLYVSGGETCGDVEHLCYQRMATFADDCLSSSCQPPAGAPSRSLNVHTIYSLSSCQANRFRCDFVHFRDGHKLKLESRLLNSKDQALFFKFLPDHKVKRFYWIFSVFIFVYQSNMLLTDVMVLRIFG